MAQTPGTKRTVMTLGRLAPLHEKREDPPLTNPEPTACAAHRTVSLVVTSHLTISQRLARRRTPPRWVRARGIFRRTHRVGKFPACGVRADRRGCGGVAEPGTARPRATSRPAPRDAEAPPPPRELLSSPPADPQGTPLAAPAAGT
jgi:hypothetical protein